MRKATILYKDKVAGVLKQHDDGSYSFKYDDIWFENDAKPAISLTLPKSRQEYHSEFLFPFFFNMLPEGTNKQVVCKLNRLDSTDYFGLLITTASSDNIGAIRVEKLDL